MRNYYALREQLGYAGDDDRFRFQIDRLPNNLKHVFLGRLEGKTRNDLGRELGVTRESIRLWFDEACFVLKWRNVLPAIDSGNRTYNERLNDDVHHLNTTSRVRQGLILLIKQYANLTIGDLAYMRDWQLRKPHQFGRKFITDVRRAVNQYLEGE